MVAVLRSLRVELPCFAVGLHWLPWCSGFFKLGTGLPVYLSVRGVVSCAERLMNLHGWLGLLHGQLLDSEFRAYYQAGILLHSNI